MSKHFYRDVKLISFCKVCGVEFRPPRASFFAMLGLCHKHRKLYYRAWYFNVYLPFFKKLTPAQQQKYRDRRYQVWLKWVTNNKERRKLQALESYHRRKHLHKDRKHRKVTA